MGLVPRHLARAVDRWKPRHHVRRSDDQIIVQFVGTHQMQCLVNAQLPVIGDSHGLAEGDPCLWQNTGGVDFERCAPPSSDRIAVK